MEDVTTED